MILEYKNVYTDW